MLRQASYIYCLDHIGAFWYYRETI